MQLRSRRRFVVPGELNDWAKDRARRENRLGAAPNEVSTSNRAASNPGVGFYSYLSRYSGLVGFKYSVKNPFINMHRF